MTKSEKKNKKNDKFRLNDEIKKISKTYKRVKVKNYKSKTWGPILKYTQLRKLT